MQASPRSYPGLIFFAKTCYLLCCFCIPLCKKAPAPAIDLIGPGLYFILLIVNVFHPRVINFFYACSDQILLTIQRPSPLSLFMRVDCSVDSHRKKVPNMQEVKRPRNFFRLLDSDNKIMLPLWQRIKFVFLKRIA